MTRENAKRTMDIIFAFAKGKVIQILNERGKWVDLTEREGLPMGALEEKPNIFRIKPLHTHRPFNNKEECWKEMLQHNPLGWFKDKKAKEFFTLNCISDKDPKIKTYEYLFNDCVFMDGSICGVKLEE